VYYTEIPLIGPFHARPTPTLFLWDRVHAGSHYFPQAQFQVYFYIRTAPPFSELDLAWVLLKFSDVHTGPSNVQLRIVGMTYTMSHTHIIGVIFFDKSLASAFESVVEYAFLLRDTERWRGGLRNAYPGIRWRKTDPSCTRWDPGPLPFLQGCYSLRVVTSSSLPLAFESRPLCRVLGDMFFEVDGIN
jgi:hypothetical protein